MGCIHCTKKADFKRRSDELMPFNNRSNTEVGYFLWLFKSRCGCYRAKVVIKTEQSPDPIAGKWDKKLTNFSAVPVINFKVELRTK